MKTHSFITKHGIVYCENLSLLQLASAVGTPAYIYSSEMLEKTCKNMKDVFSNYPTKICYAVKANGHLAILNMFSQYNLGADIVSLGELKRAQCAGIPANRIVFSGVGKQENELVEAIKSGILLINVESSSELIRIKKISHELRKKTQISFRINPNIYAKTNKKISTGHSSVKFGLDSKEAWLLLDSIKGDPYVELSGLACHIGSQMMDLSPLNEAAIYMAKLAKTYLANGVPLKYLDLGGGLGIPYCQEKAPSLSDYADILINAVLPTKLTLIIEPGRFLIGQAGILLTSIISIKKTFDKYFIVIDAAMNDLLRPTLYGAYHEILPVVMNTESKQQMYDVVGPVCETGDIFVENCLLPANLKLGDLLYICNTGAYAASMASNYNARPRAVEVMVSASSYRTIRPRESLSQLWENEKL